MKKPELLVTPAKLDDVLPLIEAGADAFFIGEAQFGLRVAGEFSREDIVKTINLTHEHGKKVYVAMNAIFHNDRLDGLEEYIRFLDETGADAIVYGDPAVLLSAREVAPNMKLHWSPEQTATNFFTCNYWGERGAGRAVMARELSMDELVETKENANVEIEVQVHGATAMFQSKRTLVTNYLNSQNKEHGEVATSRNARIHDRERDASYPIFEDLNGTHIFSSKDICIIDELEDMVDVGVDSFKIEGILKSSEWLLEATKIYRKAIDLCAEDRDAYEDAKDELLSSAEVIQPDNREMDTGFFFKETVY